MWPPGFGVLHLPKYFGNLSNFISHAIPKFQKTSVINCGNTITTLGEQLQGSQWQHGNWLTSTPVREWYPCWLLQCKNLECNWYDQLVFSDKSSPWWHTPHGCHYPVGPIQMACDAYGTLKLTRYSSKTHDGGVTWIFGKNMPHLSRQHYCLVEHSSWTCKAHWTHYGYPTAC
jgi:hypothetical protein